MRKCVSVGGRECGSSCAPNHIRGACSASRRTLLHDAMVSEPGVLRCNLFFYSFHGPEI